MEPKSEFIIYKTKRPFWHFAIASILLLLVFFLLDKTIILFSSHKITDGLKLLQATVISLICAGGLSFTKNIFVDPNTKKIRFNFTLLSFRFTKDFIFTDVKYISVYKNQRNNDFQISIWLTEIKKENISIMFNKEDAMKFAKTIAKGVDVNIFDATEKGNFKWVDKTKSP